MEKKVEILVVEDDYKNLQVLGKILSENNYDLALAKNGSEALEILNTFKPQLILMDVMMPGMDGFTLCRKIKSDERFFDIPIIFLTAKNEIEDTLEGFAAGAADFITKPFDSRILLTRIKTHLELKFRNEELDRMNSFLEEIVKERTEELRKAHTELLQLDKVKSEFLSIISHEIRTPLNGILGASQLIMQRSDPKITFLFDLLNTSVSRLEKFLLNALLLTSLKLKRHVIDFHKIHFQHLTNDLLLQLDKEIKNKKLTVKQISDNNSVTNGDEYLISKCITSLLDNAIKFSPEENEIEIKIYKENGGLCYSVTDYGPGFSEKAMNDLFKLFAPGESHIDENEGIELAITKIIMDEHKGSIEIVNNKQGATVKLIFPEFL